MSSKKKHHSITRQTYGKHYAICQNPACNHKDTAGEFKRCKPCGSYYCSKKCQHDDWARHKTIICNSTTKNRKKVLKLIPKILFRLQRDHPIQWGLMVGNAHAKFEETNKYPVLAYNGPNVSKIPSVEALTKDLAKAISSASCTCAKHRPKDHWFHMMYHKDL